MTNFSTETGGSRMDQRHRPLERRPSLSPQYSSLTTSHNDKIDEKKIRIGRKNLRYLSSGAALCASLCFLLYDPVPSSYLQNASYPLQFIARKLHCHKTPYVRVRDVVGLMPEILTPQQRIKPSHVTLCEEYLNRRETATALGRSGETHPPTGQDLLSTTLTLVEDPAVCSDWQAPHFTILQLFASALVASVGSPLGLRYRHSCHRTIPDLHADALDFDYTATQQILPANLITKEDRAAIDDATLTSLCTGCVSEYRNTPLPLHSYSATAHQCLLFPGEGSGGSTPEAQLALATLLPTITDRLRRVAQDHLPRTSSQFIPLDDEFSTGCIIFLDDTATLMHYSVYDKYVPNYITHIQIFASASCAIAAVRSQNTCIEHGRRIKRFFVQNRANQGVYVRYDVIASTASAYARMIYVHKLICPPGSVSCLLPALVKVDGTSAVIAEGSSNPETLGWFEHISDSKVTLQNIEVVELSEEDQNMPTEIIGEYDLKYNFVGIAMPLMELDWIQGRMMAEAIPQK